MTPRLDPPTPSNGSARRLRLAGGWLTLFGLGVILFVTAGHAEEAREAEPDTSYLAGEPEVLPLSLALDQARDLAVSNSPSARVARAALRSAHGSWMKESGAFDPVLYGADSRVSTDLPVTSPFAFSETRIRSLAGGLTWLSPIGTSLDFSLSQVRTETNAPFSTLPRERRAVARVEFVQPLLRGFGLAAARGELRAASRELDAAREAYAAATLDLDAAVENAYWQLYAAERNLDLQRIERQRAASFLRDQILRGEAGVVGPGAVATARTFLAEQEATLLETRIQVGSASDRLAQVMGLSPTGHERYHCLDQPPLSEPIDPLEAALARALGANPALRAAAYDSAAARERVRRAAWNAWPSLDAFGHYGGSGLAGTGRRIAFGSDTVGTTFDTDFGAAWRQVRGRDYPDWSFGIQLSMPIGWRADRGEHERQLGSYERARESLRARRIELETAVRQAHREAELSRRGLEAMRTLVAAAEEQARIARLEYQAGRATAYDLVNIEADLVRARFRESEMLVRVARAATELRRLTTRSTGRNPR